MPLMPSRASRRSDQIPVLTRLFVNGFEIDRLRAVEQAACYRQTAETECKHPEPQWLLDRTMRYIHQVFEIRQRMPRGYSSKELAPEVFALPASWGNWKLDRNAGQLVFVHPTSKPPEFYWINLHRLNTGAEMLNEIFHVGQKTWCSDEDVRQLLRALDDIFLPQKFLCSLEPGECLNVKKYLQERYQLAENTRKSASKHSTSADSNFERQS